jgi:nicotinamide-nucleotide amidase
MKTHVKAVLIAVGTEITSGQIINRNTAWLAAPLSEAGLAPLLHWSVPDERSLILEAIAQAAAISPLIFLTGGLGPTSDDFTRLLVSEWSQRPLIFSEESWQRVVTRIQNSKFEISESQRQQCWFPEGADILPNPVGTADGFWLSHEGTEIIVLPGPPREVAALWDSGLAQKLVPFFPVQVPRQLYTWQCMGVPEGTLAEQVDAALRPFDVEVGYRAHFPYIEVKVWIAAEEDTAAVKAALAPVIDPWMVLGHGEEAATRFLQHLGDRPLQIVDMATHGALSQRLLPVLQKNPFAPGISIAHYLASPMAEAPQELSPHESMADAHLHLQIQCLAGEREYGILLTAPHCVPQRFKVQVPLRYDALLAQQYLAEYVLLNFPAWQTLMKPLKHGKLPS